MKKIFVPATEAEVSFLRSAMEDYHRDIAEHEVRVGLMFIHGMNSDEELVPALRVHGASAAAQISLVKGKKRVFNPNDAEIVVDRYTWDESNNYRKRAILDHELEHLELVLDSNGIAVRDDQNRQKLKLKPDDFSLTGFFSIVRRHGANAVETTTVTETSDQVNTIMGELQTAGRRVAEHVIG